MLSRNQIVTLETFGRTRFYFTVELTEGMSLRDCCRVQEADSIGHSYAYRTNIHLPSYIYIPSTLGISSDSTVYMYCHIISQKWSELCLNDLFHPISGFLKGAQISPFSAISFPHFLLLNGRFQILRELSNVQQ